MTENSNISIEDNQIPISSTVKYIGFFHDPNLTFQQEVKNVLRQKTCGIKTLNAIKSPFNINTRVIMNSLALSHLHYSSIILNSITQNRVASLEQQLNSTIISCFNRQKIDCSRDLNVRYRVLPIRYFLDFKR